jgi:uncharacterized protein YpmS
MIQLVMKHLLNDGPQFNQLRRYSFLLFLCLLVNLLFYIHIFFYILEPNDESAANVNAAKMWREDKAQFERTANQLVRSTLGFPSALQQQKVLEALSSS